MLFFIARLVPGVLHSLQSKYGQPLDPKRSMEGTPIGFIFTIPAAPGPNFSGVMVRREGPFCRLC
mgnify:CR=1 FL=1